MIFRDDGGDDDDDDEAGLAARRAGDELKRTRTQSELDALGVIPAAQAWPFSVRDLLASADADNAHGGGVQNAGGLEAYIAGRSTIVLCVLEHLDIHYRLLCAILPHLRRISPLLQPLLLCRDPAAVVRFLRPPPCFPVVPAKGHPHNHFLKLGLLHPLGGGQAAMDAILLIDAHARRRLVLPFGWGAGRHVEDKVGGELVQERLMEALKQGVEQLERERGGA